MNKRIVILGAGESGVGAALLAQKKGYDVWVSDAGGIATQYQQELTKHNIAFEEHQHTVEKILNADAVVKSPGIPNTAAIIQKLKAQKTLIMSEIEFGYQHSKGQVIAITGSNGKTTTSTLTHEILKSKYPNVVLAGNIGDSYAKQVSKDDQEFYVLEVSSFQLDDTQTFAPYVGVITNISPDHLERYDNDFEKYIAAKLAITKYQKEGDYLIYDADNKILVDAIKNYKTKAILVPFSLEIKLDYGVYIDQGVIHVNMGENKSTIALEHLTIKGKHNQKNAMVSNAIGSILKIKNKEIKAAFERFQGINHRLENVTKIGNIRYINDSKATNINAVYYALESMTTPVVWIVGGVDKGNDYTQLFSMVREKVRAIICIGFDNEKIIEAYQDIVPYLAEAKSMEQAVNTASKIAKDNDTVLLSPACASFDLFKNYEDRGNQFKQQVKLLED